MLTSELEIEVSTWESIYHLLLSLARRVRKTNFKPDMIVSVSRGGWIPSRVMSDLLEIPRIAIVGAEFYTGVAETKGAPVITQPVSVSVRGTRVLVVDDIADTGKSLRLVCTHLEEHGTTEIRTATLYLKPWSTSIPDYYGKKTTSWVVFPWERKEIVRTIVDRYRLQGKSAAEAKEKLVTSGLERELVTQFITELFGDKI